MLFGTGHGIDAGSVVDGAVQVIDAVGQAELGGSPADHGPVGLDVVEVIEVDAADGVVAQVLDDADLR